MYTIVGLTGPAGAGKDTVAEMIQRIYGFKRIAFAHTLKNMLAIAGMPEPERELKEALLPGLPFSWRRAAQTLGTEWGRSLDPDLWVKLTMLHMQRNPGNYVISDVRFENETAAIRQLGGTIVHIHGRKTDLVGGTAKHASEAQVKQEASDLLLPNDGDLRLLQDWTIITMSALFNRNTK